MSLYSQGLKLFEYDIILSIYFTKKNTIEFVIEERKKYNINLYIYTNDNGDTIQNIWLYKSIRFYVEYKSLLAVVWKYRFIRGRVCISISA